MSDTNTIIRKPKGWRKIIVNGKLYFWSVTKSGVFAMNAEIRKKFLLTYMFKDIPYHVMESDHLSITPAMV